jgi:hypothetical protein
MKLILLESLGMEGGGAAQLTELTQLLLSLTFWEESLSTLSTSYIHCMHIITVASRKVGKNDS